MKKINASSKTLIVIISLTFLLIGTVGCHSEEHSEHADTHYTVTEPLLKDTIITKEYVCQIHSINHIELRALERGFLQNIYTDEGQFVKEGQLLFQIMPKIYEADYQKALAEAEFAKIEYENTKLLADSNVVSQNQFLLAKAKYEQAKAELTLAEVHLGFTEIHAPFDGIIDKFHVRLGSLIEEGDLLTNLSDNSKMWVYFNVSEAEYLDYQSSEHDSLMNVKLRMANSKMFPYTGKVETIEADFNNETGNIAFRATFPNPDGLLRHGETGNIQMEVPLENVLLIPQKATFEILDKKYVYVVDENNVVSSREIIIEAEMPHIFAVRSGLNEGERILLEGINKVSHGDVIKSEYQAPEYVLSHLELYSE